MRSIVFLIIIFVVSVCAFAEEKPKDFDLDVKVEGGVEEPPPAIKRQVEPVTSNKIWRILVDEIPNDIFIFCDSKGDCITLNSQQLKGIINNQRKQSKQTKEKKQ